jgi:hypothetical protein
MSGGIAICAVCGQRRAVKVCQSSLDRTTGQYLERNFCEQHAPRPTATRSAGGAVVAPPEDARCACHSGPRHVLHGNGRSQEASTMKRYLNGKHRANCSRCGRHKNCKRLAAGGRFVCKACRRLARQARTAKPPGLAVLSYHIIRNGDPIEAGPSMRYQSPRFNF